MRPIHHTFGPLADASQRRMALRLLFQPHRWKEGPEGAELERALEGRFGGEAHLISSGREALFAILTALKFQKDEEVIVQGYTCVVVPNAIVAAGMTPVYADIDPDTLNLDLAEVERLITPRTRAVVCQHTFGIPSFTKELRALCDRHSLTLIEDCAHAIAEENDSPIGAHGDLLFFSFGRDKALSGVAGGAVICRLKEVCPEIKRMKDEASHLGLIAIKRFLLYPLIYGLAKPVYGIGLGKALLAFARTVRLLPSIVTAEEKHGRMAPKTHRMPNACAVLALDQWRRLKAINNHRRMLTAFYFEEGTKRGWPMLLGVKPGLALQKFPLFAPRAESIRRALKAKNIHLHDGWTGCTICPASTACEAVGYKDGDDPKADMAGTQILSLPTHPDTSLKQAKKLTELLDPLLP